MKTAKTSSTFPYRQPASTIRFLASDLLSSSQSLGELLAAHPGLLAKEAWVEIIRVSPNKKFVVNQAINAVPWVLTNRSFTEADRLNFLSIALQAGFSPWQEITSEYWRLRQGYDGAGFVPDHDYGFHGQTYPHLASYLLKSMEYAASSFLLLCASQKVESSQGVNNQALRFLDALVALDVKSMSENELTDGDLGRLSPQEWREETISSLVTSLQQQITTALSVKKQPNKKEKSRL